MGIYDADDAALDEALGDVPYSRPGIEDEKQRRAKIEDALKALVDEYDRFGQEERIWQLAEIQHCLMLWHGESSLYWNPTARSWQSIWDAYEAGLVDEEDVEEYDRDINFYRPLLESVIAAATVEVPRVHTVPARPSDPSDIVTSREATKVSTYLDTVNEAKTLLHEAHFILANQHFVAGYTYFEQDAEKYGVETEDIIGPVEKSRFVDICPQCGGDITEQPEADPSGLYKPCPGCGQLVEPQPDQETYMDEGVIGQQTYPKSKVCMEVYGPRHVRLPYNIKKLEATPFLDLSIEESVAFLADVYKEQAEKILGMATPQTDKYDRWAREPVNAAGGGAVSDQVTHRRIWFRPWAFNLIKDVETRQLVRTEYKDGALVILINDLFIKCIPSKLDTHWTITETPFAETIHDDPGGKILHPINEIQNDLIQLWLENIKHNIPEMLVDAQLFDLEQYAKQMGRPGLRTPVKRPPGQTVSAAIHETRAVTISQESMQLWNIIETIAQFASRAMPSIFGGFLQKGSETAFEYDASRQAALQRIALQLVMVNSWWARLKFKAIELYRQNAVRSREYAARSGTTYRPVIIDPENLKGGIDQVLPEISSAFPTAWSQKRDFVINGLQSGNEALIQLFMHPENSTFLKEVIGIPELFVPGEQDRLKQLWEISELLKSPPLEMPVMGQMGPEMSQQPTIMPDPRTDNGPAHIITLQNWLNGDDGREAQRNNSDGYDNVIAHLTEHIKLMGPPAPAAGPEGEEVPPPV